MNSTTIILTKEDMQWIRKGKMIKFIRESGIVYIGIDFSKENPTTGNTTSEEAKELLFKATKRWEQ